MVIPPYAGVKLVEFSDRLELMPYGWFRNCVALGKHKANEVGFQPEEQLFAEWNKRMGDHEIYVVVCWKVFENDSDEVEYAIYCGPGTNLETAEKVFEGLIEYLDSIPKDRDTEEGAQNCLRHIRGLVPPGLRLWLTHGNVGRHYEERDDYGAIPQSYSDQKTSETREMYQARLKALAGMQPKTVALIEQADRTEDSAQREKLEREAVQAYFAELGTYWSDDMLMAWQRNNPLASKWLCEFGKMMEMPERDLDPINQELALNWIRRGYNLMTENELAEAIFTVTGQRVKPNTLKKKRVGLGLSTKRPSGPRPNSEQ